MKNKIILNLTISDFPPLESATRSGEVYGKTSWEEGDQLLIEFYKAEEGESIFGELPNSPSTYHFATYSDGGWTLDTPMEVVNVVMIFWWAFAEKELTNSNKVNWARASVILLTAFVIAVALLGGILLFGWYIQNH